MENELDKNVNEDSETKEPILQNENENVDETNTQNQNNQNVDSNNETKQKWNPKLIIGISIVYLIDLFLLFKSFQNGYNPGKITIVVSLYVIFTLYALVMWVGSKIFSGIIEKYKKDRFIYSLLYELLINGFLYFAFSFFGYISVNKVGACGFIILVLSLIHTTFLCGFDFNEACYEKDKDGNLLKPINYYNLLLKSGLVCGILFIPMLFLLYPIGNFLNTSFGFANDISNSTLDDLRNKFTFLQ